MYVTFNWLLPLPRPIRNLKLLSKFAWQNDAAFFGFASNTTSSLIRIVIPWFASLRFRQCPKTTSKIKITKNRLKNFLTLERPRFAWPGVQRGKRYNVTVPRTWILSWCFERMKVRAGNLQNTTQHGQTVLVWAEDLTQALETRCNQVDNEQRFKSST